MNCVPMVTEEGDEYTLYRIDIPRQWFGVEIIPIQFKIHRLKIKIESKQTKFSHFSRKLRNQSSAKKNAPASDLSVALAVTNRSRDIWRVRTVQYSTSCLPPYYQLVKQTTNLFSFIHCIVWYSDQHVFCFWFGELIIRRSELSTQNG